MHDYKINVRVGDFARDAINSDDTLRAEVEKAVLAVVSRTFRKDETFSEDETIHAVTASEEDISVSVHTDNAGSYTVQIYNRDDMSDILPFDEDNEGMTTML